MFNKDMARQNDERLTKLANYIESKGLTRHIRGIEHIFKRFGYLKCLLKNGTFASIDDLEESVYKIYGVVENSLDSSEFSDMMDLLNKVEEDLDRYEKRKKE